MIRKTGTTFAGSFAAARKNKSRPMIEELEDRNFLSAASGGGVPTDQIAKAGPPVVTENFKRVAEEQKVEGLVLDPAQWVA